MLHRDSVLKWELYEIYCVHSPFTLWKSLLSKLYRVILTEESNCSIIYSTIIFQSSAEHTVLYLASKKGNLCNACGTVVDFEIEVAVTIELIFLGNISHHSLKDANTRLSKCTFFWPHI